MRILVTGGAGFIGSHLVDALVGRHQVTVIDDLSTGKKANLNPKAKFIRAKVESPKVAAIVRAAKPQAVFHFAAQKDVRMSVVDPVMDATANVIGLLRVLTAAREVNCERIVFASTGGAIYGNPQLRPKSHRGVFSEVLNQHLPYIRIKKQELRSKFIFLLPSYLSW